MLFIRWRGQQDARCAGAARQAGNGLAQNALAQFGKQVLFKDRQLPLCPGIADALRKRGEGVEDKSLQPFSAEVLL